MSEIYLHHDEMNKSFIQQLISDEKKQIALLQ